MNTETDENPGTEVIYRVNSFRVPCVGVGPMQCLQIQRGDDASGQWQFFYSQIRGFDFEPGYLYRLRVRETRLPPAQVPADASSIRYDLVEVLDKSPDPRMPLHDIWALEAIDGVSPAELGPGSTGPQPVVEFNITRQAYLGQAACGAFRGEILAVDAKALRLGPAVRVEAGATCTEAALETPWPAALADVAEWRRDGLALELKDADGVTLLRFRKID